MVILSKPRFWAWPRQLKRRGVLGINARNLNYISRLNPRQFYPRVDDKVLTKQICDAAEIPVPQTYAVIDRYGDLKRFAELVGNRQQFVIKPVCGAGGRGVLIIVRQDGREFETSGGQVLSLAEVRYHLSTILSGLYSLAGQPDLAIVEQRITRHPVFESMAIGGTPDIRVIVHEGTPAMAMLRLPTRESRGRANLHQGAVGAGVDIATGRTVAAVCHNRTVTAHPDTGAPIVGIAIPHWSDVLIMTTRLSQALELGYVGVDIVLDAGTGPVVLEANARPGLSIQIANQCGLLARIEALPISAARMRALVDVIPDGYDPAVGACSSPELLPWYRNHRKRKKTPMCKPRDIDRKLGRMMSETCGFTWRSVAIIVAHPDDEAIWCGGLLLQNPGWDWTIMSLCRGNDNDRRRKFDRFCDLLQAQGIICDLDDSNPLKPIDPVIEVGRRIRQYLCDFDFDICITHGENGEYGHERHRQVHTEVLRLVCNGVLCCHELWTFAYVCDAKTGACEARHDADIRIELTAEQLAEKKRILREEYGYAEDSFEVKACVSPEGFHRHSITDQGKHR